MEAVLGARKPVVLVLTGGSNIASPHFKKAAAVLMAWYPGGEGGTAVADVLFGDHNPAGRLPLTFYASTRELPPFTDYGMKNRTYRYFTGEPLWPFGAGRSYTSFRYGGLKLSAAKIQNGRGVDASIDVQNTGKRDGEEVVQAYVTDEAASVTVPVRTLVGFRRVPLRAGERRTVTFTLGPRSLSLVNEAGKRLVEPGWFTIAIGGAQPGRGGRYPAGAGATGRLEVTGDAVAVK
jgi:beta-glucosidase